MHSGNGNAPIQFGLTSAQLQEMELSEPDANAPRHRKGNIFGAPELGEVFKGYGLDQANQAKTKGLLEKLARRMSNLKASDLFAPFQGDNKDNPRIPAGYTYLAQLVAHDLVANVVAGTNGAPDGDFTRRDFRNERLVLETLYGGGPSVAPFVYARPNGRAEHNVRTRMRLGRPYREERLNKPREFENFEEGIFWFRQDRHDIPRTSCPYLNEEVPNRGFSDPLLADTRNDDNLILSQICTIFMDLHNWMIEITEEALQQTHGQISDFQATANFVKVRKMVALVYRTIVRKDLFARLLEDTVFARYALGEAAIPQPARGIETMAEDNRVPVEFSHAVFRAAHGMIRDGYTLNVMDHAQGDSRSLRKVLMRTSSRSVNLTPIACDWLVDWDMFFQMNEVGNGPQPNLSVRFRPEFLGGPLTGNTFFKGPDGRKDGGLVYLDLLRGAEGQVRSVASLASKIAPEDRRRSGLLPDADSTATAPWVAPITQWLSASLPVNIGLDDMDIQTIADDPPLYLFTLLEAAMEQDGECLGILGSTVVAEVVADALRQNWQFIEDDAAIVAATETFFEGDIPQDMPALIKALNGANRQRRTSCAPLIS